MKKIFILLFGIALIYSCSTSTNSNGNSTTNVVPVVTTTNLIHLPTLTTTAVSSITAVSAVSGGTILSDEGGPITAMGVCWSTNTNPTIVYLQKQIMELEK